MMQPSLVTFRPPYRFLPRKKRLRISHSTALVQFLPLRDTMSEWWDDFSNNLATDLGPLVALFGETPTKQYLSECLNLVDIIIFATCPLGIITAIVSAIRVCGTPSLRAFIGRAQEGGGSAEAELCSSTSRDVCELYNNGGIARVFGRPKLLEFVHVTKPPHTDFYPPQNKTPTAGIHASSEYFNHLSKDDQWRELGNKDASDEEKNGRKKTPNFAPNPNLSLNVGIKPRSRFWFFSAAVLGTVLQSAVLVWAVLTRSTLHLVRDGTADYYAVPFTIAGTILLCSGMACCAFLVERSTGERVFERKVAQGDERKTSIYWVQPGNQHVGDQVFDSFSYTHHKEPLDRYTTSWKKPNTVHVEYIWISASTTILGFVLQFLGLRACHSSVAVVQLGVTLAMSLVRASLRTERLKREENPLASNPDMYQGHELDWLALQLGRGDPQLGGPSRSSTWHVSSFSGLPDVRRGRVLNRRPEEVTKPPPKAFELFCYRARLGELTGLGTVQVHGSRAWDEHHVVVRQSARAVVHAIEKTMQVLFDVKSSTKPVKVAEDWKKASGIFWALPCSVCQKDATRNRKVTENPDIIYLSVKREATQAGGSEGLWQASTSEIEAAVGLWLWSLKCQTWPKIEDPKEFEQVNTEREENISRILSLDENDEVDFELWRSRGVNAISKSPLKISSYLNGSWNPRQPGQRPEDPDPRGKRIFGWPVEPPSRSSQDEVKALEIPITSSLAEACAQEVYALFLSAALTMVEEIGGNTIIESPSLRQVNDNVSSILEAFTTSGLGSAGDAFSCVLPALKRHDRLPRAADALNQARVDAERLIREKEWEKAEKLLHWAIAHSAVTEVQSGPKEPEANEYRLSLILLCECYRKASLSKDSAPIGIRGISLLLDHHVSRPVQRRLTLQTSAGAPLLLSDTLSCYSEAILAYACEEGMIQTDRGQERQLRDDQHTPIVSSIALHKAVKSHNLTKALYHLSGGTKSEDGFSRTALSYAAEWGWYPVVQSLVEDGSPVQERDEVDRTPLSYAAANGDQNTFSFLLNKDTFPDSGDKQNRTALSYAAENNHLAVLKMLLQDQRVYAEVEDREGRTALWWAVRRGHEEVAHVLLQKTRVKSTESPNHGHLLYWAAIHGLRGIAEQIIERGFDVNARGNEQFSSALEAASAAGREKTVELLLSKNADPNVRGGFFGSPLQAALAFGHEAVAELLLEKGADLHAKGGYHGTPEQAALASGKDAVIQLLKRHGVEMNTCEGKYHENVLQDAARRGHESIVQLLLEGGADVHGQGCLALQGAVDSEKAKEIVQILLENGVDVNAQGGSYGNVLQAAAVYAEKEIVQLLLDKGADVNAKGGPYGNALQAAAFKAKKEIVQILLENGADVNGQGGMYDSALQAAVIKANKEIVQILLKNGADVNAKVRMYGSALEAAVFKGEKEIAQILRDGGAKDFDDAL